MFLLEPSYTVFTLVHWEGARGSTFVGLHVIVLQDPLNGGHSSVKVLCGCDCIQTYSEIKI